MNLPAASTSEEGVQELAPNRELCSQASASLDTYHCMDNLGKLSNDYYDRILVEDLQYGAHTSCCFYQSVSPVDSEASSAQDDDGTSLTKRRSNLLPPVEACEADDLDDDSLSSGPPLDPESWFSMIEANKVTYIKKNLKRADLDAQKFYDDLGVSMSGLHLAVLHGHRQLAKLLISYGCDINSLTKPGECDEAKFWNATPLHFAVIQSDLKMIRTLLEAGCDGERRFRTWRNTGDERFLAEMDAVYYAASLGIADILTYLLHHGGDPNSQVMLIKNNKKDDSALHIAVQNLHVKVIEKLLLYKAEIDIVNLDICSPLMVAVEKGNADIVDTLLKKGKPSLEYKYLWSENKLCLTAFQVACLKNLDLIASLLIKAGSQIDAVCPLTGKTALHIAGRAGNLEAVELLLQHGADVNAQDKLGKTAYEDTKDGSNHHDVLTLLETEETRLKENFQIDCPSRAGVCMIFAVYSFDDDSESLTESASQCEALKEAFQHNGYKVRLHHNPTASEIKSILKSAVKDLVKPHHESFVCCISSHGGLRCVFGSDGQRLPIRHMTNVLRASLCAKLMNKLKLFIIDACQGVREVVTDADEGPPSSSSFTMAQPDGADEECIPEENFVVWNSTLPGRVAYADANFFGVLAERLMEVGPQPVSFATIQKDVAEQLKNTRIEERYKQVSVVQTTEVSSSYGISFRERQASN